MSEWHRRIHSKAKELRGTDKVRKHLTVALMAVGVVPIMWPPLAAHAAVAAVLVNVIWLWEV